MWHPLLTLEWQVPGDQARLRAGFWHPQSATDLVRRGFRGRLRRYGSCSGLLRPMADRWFDIDVCGRRTVVHTKSGLHDRLLVRPSHFPRSESSYLTINRLGYQILFGAGAGCSLEQCSIAVQTVLPKEKVSAGISLIVFARALGGAIGSSVGENVSIWSRFLHCSGYALIILRRYLSNVFELSSGRESRLSTPLLSPIRAERPILSTTYVL